MFTMRVTPKRSDRPAATKNRPEAAESPLRAWNRRALWVIARTLPPPQVGPARLAHYSCETRASPGFVGRAAPRVGRAAPRVARNWIARPALSRSSPKASSTDLPRWERRQNLSLPPAAVFSPRHRTEARK